MTEENCSKYESCGAPLCPLDPPSLTNGIWYPDEEICKARKFQYLPWIEKQKRIIKHRLTADNGFFTVKMLYSIRAVTKTLKGANPDDPDSETKWLKKRGAPP